MPNVTEQSPLPGPPSSSAPAEPFFDTEWMTGFQIQQGQDSCTLLEWRNPSRQPAVLGLFPDRESALSAAHAAMPQHILWRRQKVGGTGRQAMILVPSEAGELRLGLVPLSAVVAIPKVGTTGFEVYYEGNTMGASNLVTWEQRVKCAAGRLFKSYPTIARSYLQDLPSDQFTNVGVVTDDYRIEVFNETAVEAFLSRADVPQRQERSKDRFSAQRG
jgi:hypothetical protein